LADFLDPTRAAALGGLRNTGAPPGQSSMPQGIPQQMPPQGQGQENEVAMYLSMAFDALMRTGPTPENGAAIQQFLMMLKQLLSGAVPEQGMPQGQGAMPQAQGMPPQGAPPMMPQSGMSLPPR